MRFRVAIILLALVFLFGAAASAQDEWIAVDIESPLEITPDWNEPDSPLLAMARNDGLIYFEDIDPPLGEFLQTRARCIFESLRPSQLMQRLTWVKELDLSEYEGTLTDERWLWMFDTESLTAITITDATFDNLDVISAFENLEELTLLNSGNFDLTPLANCESLTTLTLGWDDEYMGAAGEIDLTPLQDISKINSLALYGSGIRSIEPLESICRRFRTLTLSDTAIEDFTPLKKFTKLTNLTLDLLHSSVAAEIMNTVPKDIKQLTLQRIILDEEAETASHRFKSLTDYSIIDCDISNATFYEELNKATRLTLSSIAIAGGERIGEIYADKTTMVLRDVPEAVMISMLGTRSTALTTLTIDIADLTTELNDALKKKTSATSVTVNLTADVDLTGDMWNRLSGIRYLTISSTGNTLTSTDFLDALTSMRTLTLSGVAIDNTAGIGVLDGISQLNVYGCRIGDWSFLSNLKRLATVKIYGSELENDTLVYLADLPALDDLRLNGNNITDISELVTSDTIRKLDILDNPIDNYAALLLMPALRTVYLDQGGIITDNSILARSVYIDDVDYEAIYQEAFGAADGEE